MLRKFSCKTLVLAVCLVCMGALTSCIDDTFGKWLGLGDGIKITYTIDGMTDENGNKAPASRGFTDDDGGEMLRSVHFIFFNEETGAYATHTSVTYTAENPAPQNNNFSISPTLTDGVRYKTLIVGNAAAFTPNDFNSYDEYIESMKTLKYDEMRSKLFVSGPVTLSSYPLAGEWVDGSGKPSSFVISDGVVNGSVRFRRSVARIDIINSIPVDDLTEIKVQVCNARTGAHLFHETVLHEDAGNYAQTTPFNDEVKNLGNWQDLEFSADGTIPTRLYVFPNSSKAPEKGDLQTTCLLLRGRYKNGPTFSYYRFNIVKEDNAQSLNANHCYKVLLQSVEQEGKSSAELAWADESLIKFEYLNYHPNKDGVITIEGFDPTPVTNHNGVISSPMAIKVISSRPDEFDVYVRNGFDSNVDAFVSSASTIQNGEKMKSYHQLSNNPNAQLLPLNTNPSAVFYLQVFRTGPGDEPFSGQIYLLAYPKGANIYDESVQPAFISKPINVKINTNCLLEEVLLTPDKFAGFYYKSDDYNKTQADTDAEKNTNYIWYNDWAQKTAMPTGVKAYVVSDRSMSAAPRWQDGNFVPAYYYNEESSIHCGGMPGNYNSYGKILPPVQFRCAHGCHIKAQAYNWIRDALTQGGTGDPFWFAAGSQAKWHRDLPILKDIIGYAYQPFDVRPSSTGMVVATCFDKNIAVSKNRLFLISDFKKNGKYVGCYLQTGVGSRQLYYGWSGDSGYLNSPYCAPSYTAQAGGTINGKTVWKHTADWTSSSTKRKSVRQNWCYMCLGGSKTSLIPVGGITMGHKFAAFYAEHNKWITFKMEYGSSNEPGQAIPYLVRGSFEVGSPRPWRPIFTSEWPASYDQIYTPR